MTLTKGQIIALETILDNDSYLNYNFSFNHYIDLLHKESELTLSEMFECDTTDNLENFIRDLAKRIDRTISLESNK